MRTDLLALPLPDRSEALPCPRRSIVGMRVPEVVEMLWAIVKGRIGPGTGWWHPGESLYGWEWLAVRHGVDLGGAIARHEFQGPAEFLDRLDRNRDGLLTAADFHWPAGGRIQRVPPPWRLLLLGRFLWSLFRHRGATGLVQEGPLVGQRAPDFALKTRDGKRRITLSEHRGKRPVVLIFGSFT